MNIKTRILLLVGLALGTSACHKEWAKGVGEEDETCAVSLALRPDYTVDEVVLTRSVEHPAEDDFNVRIENTRAEVLREWKYAELPNLIKVVPGSYKLVACYGSDTLLPAFDTPYYYGETKVTLKDGDNLDTIVKTAVGAVKVALTFDESFDFDYDDYFVEVKTVGDSLHFAKDEEREGYFLPGSLRMRFGLKPRGQEAYYEFYPPAIKAVKASEFYRMTLKAQSDHGALSKISIETDSTTLDIPVDVELPTFFLPKAAPKVTFRADTTGDGRLVVLEGEKKNAMALISSAGGLVGLKIKADEVAQSQGLPAEIDLMQADEATLNDLKAKGLEWDEKITAGGVVKSLVWVRFDEAISQLTAPSLQMIRSELSVCATDRFGQETESKISLETHPVLFAELPTEADIWAKRAEMKVRIGGADETYIEYKSPEGEWQRATLEEISKGTDRADYWVKNLEPNQEYVFRACVGDYKSIQEFAFVTEKATQVPNSGFEDWHYTEQSGAYWKLWYVCASGETPVWNSLNEKTTSEGGGNKGTTSYAYIANSGTLQTSDSYSGGLAALVRTVGWGKGTTAPGPFWDGNMKRVDAGYLYTGEYSEEPETTWNPLVFNSRPSKINYYYKYTPAHGKEQSDDKYVVKVVVENREHGEVIKLAEAILEEGGNVDSYSLKSIPLNYVDVAHKATHIYIMFKSGHVTEYKYFQVPPRNNLSDGEYVGSQLYIDDIELIYE